MLDESLPEKTIKLEYITLINRGSPVISKCKCKARQKAFTRGDKPRYKQLCEKVANLIAKTKAIYYRSKASEFRTTNQSKWYKCIYSLVNAENTTHTQFPHSPENLDLSELAEKLQEAFTKPWLDRYTNADSQIAEMIQPTKNNNPPLPSIGQVNPRKATGIDKVPAWLLKKYHEDVAPVVHDIVCCSISHCHYPSLYKHALISPVPKVQPPRDINNDFRQISVLPQLAKILEKIQLQLSIEDMKIKITLINLVDHNILLNKLALMNINKPFWLWIKNFLSGRVQQVNFMVLYHLLQRARLESHKAL